MAFGLDYSVARPSHSAMKTAGVQFVMRYIGSANHTVDRHPKFLSPGEARSLHADGFDIGVVFETTAGRAGGGRSAGLADAHLAAAELAYCGLPASAAVYLAVDYDATVGPKISAYFQAAGEVLGVPRTGVYGGYRVVKALRDKGLVGRTWQTYAWSGGKWDPRNDLEQYSNNRRVGDADVDYNRSLKTDFGQWPAVGAVKPDKEEDDDMASNGVLQARENIPNGRSELTLSIKNGTSDQLGIWGDPTYDNPDAGYAKCGPGQFRVIAHVKSRTGVVFKDQNKDSPTYGTEVISVGFEADGKGWCDKVVLVMPSGKKADGWKVTRLDNEACQFGADISHTG